MFLGHFGVSFALKKYDQSLSLGFLFIAVQLVDYLFPIFYILGIENARIVPGFAEASYLDLYDYPVTHSLLGTFFWAIATYFVFRYGFLRSSPKTEVEKNHTSLLMGIAVFSHYVLDYLVHTPDLLIIPGIDVKIGLGLWNFLLVSIVIELVFLLGGFFIYFKVTTSGIGVVGKYGMPLFMAILLLGSVTFLTPDPPLPDLDILGASAIQVFIYLVISSVAFWLNGTRNPIKN
ncbi:MAG: hypothetical protein ACXABI_03605 [Candidatus Hodarchaeales archaeon]|jgi:hypothetical protein